MKSMQMKRGLTDVAGSESLQMKSKQMKRGLTDVAGSESLQMKGPQRKHLPLIFYWEHDLLNAFPRRWNLWRDLHQNFSPSASTGTDHFWRISIQTDGVDHHRDHRPRLLVWQQDVTPCQKWMW
jgi:hypothetical protein